MVRYRGVRLGRIFSFVCAGQLVGDDLIRLDFDVDLRTLFQLHLVAIAVDQAIGNPDLAI